ncbi:uncharacterized protein LOC116423915 [Nomia melanderi]|uniref:uncharacterized protein LOC116423915 n=1 Tax=Nomia melanderi TaxID=2448451 RepID=UPI001304052A|nr:uncharacterized protein LOC116423915 [Nomia melanderi]
MALKVCLLATIAITVLIGISSVYAWNPEVHRYESYDLDRGPVFYEAYYPDSSDESRGSYPEKRFFDREAVLEKTYQVPSQRLAYPESAVRLSGALNQARGPPQDAGFSAQAQSQPLDIKEISNLARRAISRDLENWNTIESYLDRAKYQEPSYRRRIVVPEERYGIERSARGIGPGLSDSFKDGRDFNRDLYEEIREEPFQSADQRMPDAARRLAARDLAGRDTLTSFGPIRYQNQAPREPRLPASLLKDPYPPENIFAPRPQVINYIFSKKPVVAENEAQSAAPKKEATDEAAPRNYGDNLIQEEIGKQEGKQDVKVTSIEVSEVPRHKTRHHHGEWPKRDYSKRHQS